MNQKNLGCTQRESKTNKMDRERKSKNVWTGSGPQATHFPCPTTWKDTQSNVAKKISELANKKFEQFSRLSLIFRDKMRFLGYARVCSMTLKHYSIVFTFFDFFRFFQVVSNFFIFWDCVQYCVFFECYWIFAHMRLDSVIIVNICVCSNLRQYFFERFGLVVFRILLYLRLFSKIFEMRGNEEYNIWNSRDVGSETFGERTVFESECEARIVWVPVPLLLPWCSMSTAVDSQCILVCWGSRVFQACVVVNVKTSGLFLRITQNGVSIPALVALWCVDKGLFARARWTRSVVWSLSVLWPHAVSCMAQVKKVIRIVLQAYVTHFPNLAAERWVPGSVNSWLTGPILQSSLSLTSGKVSFRFCGLLTKPICCTWETSWKRSSRTGTIMEDWRWKVSSQTHSRATKTASCPSVSGQTSSHRGLNGLTKISKYAEIDCTDARVVQGQLPCRSSARISLGSWKGRRVWQTHLSCNEETYSRYRSGDCGHR